MPIYEYECTQCNNVEEILQKINDKPVIECKHCSGKLQRIISQSSFHLKGSGWYVTDYANKSETSSKNNKEDKSSVNTYNPAEKNIKADDKPSS